MAAAAIQETHIYPDDITEVVVDTITSQDDSFTVAQKTFIKDTLRAGFYTYRYHETDGPMDWFDNLMDLTIPEHKGIFATIWFSCIYPCINVYNEHYSAMEHQDYVRRQMSNIIRYLIVT